MAVEAINNAVASYNRDRAGAPQKTEYVSSVRAESKESAPIVISEAAAVEKTAKSQREESMDGEEKQEGRATQKQIRNAVSQANSKMRAVRTGCEFSYHEITKRVSIKVIDKDTKEVIREIPPEKSLKMIEKMWELAGILIDEKM